MSQCNYRKIGIVIRNKNICDSKSIVPYMCTIVLIFLFFVCLFVDFSVSCRMSVKHVAINTLTRRPRFIRDYFFSALFFQMKGFWQSSPFMCPDFVVVAVVVCLFCPFCCAQKKREILSVLGCHNLAEINHFLQNYFSDVRTEVFGDATHVQSQQSAIFVF